MKEKEAVTKERKSWAEKEEAMKKYTRNTDEKNRLLEEKYKKVLQKGEKVEHRNVFEVYNPVAKTERTLLQK
jgi:hypothetical protein